MSGPRSVVNTHHYGGLNKLPPDVLYIGRPSEYGNRHMRDDGRTREEHVALNRIDIYHQIHHDPNHLSQLHRDMDGKDLACWCKSGKKLVSCHGDNYMHVLSDDVKDRDWTKSVTTYLIGDLRISLRKLYDYAMKIVSDADYIPSYFDWAETKLQIETLIALMKKENWPLEDAHFALACVAVDLELALMDMTKEGRDYRLLHANWIMNSIFQHWQDRAHEPSPPEPVIEKPKKGKQ